MVGNVTAYMIYDSTGRPVKRVDVDPTSAPHGGIPPPHVETFVDNVTPGGMGFRRPGATRAATSDEFTGLRNDLP